MIRAAILLAAMLLAYLRFLRGGGGRRRPAGHRLVRPAWRMLVAFGGTATVALVLLGRIDATVSMPTEFARARDVAAAWTGIAAPADLPVVLLVGSMTAGGVLGGLVARWRGRSPATLGDIGALLPRTGPDLIWGALLSLDAGVCEELFFRLAMPLLVALVTGDAVAGFLLSAALFGLAHQYQGLAGVAATTLVALLLSAAYLLTGRLWLAMVLHAALDLNALVVRPLVAGRLNLAPGSRS